MILCLDVGNSQIYGGVFEGEKLLLNFRRTSKTGASSDELGLFLKAVLRENTIEPQRITQIAICSVVPEAIHSLRNCCRKYFDMEPFIFQPGVKTGLKIKYRNPLEVGADRIANAVAASQKFPGSNLIIVDFGTATTFCAVSKERDYLGGIIHPGLRISMEVLEERTSRLPSVEILRPQTVVARSTVESIQSGLYYGHLAMVKELKIQIRNECFPAENVVTIGTGGFSRLFEDAQVFDHIVPDLVLNGLLIALELNSATQRSQRQKNIARSNSSSSGSDQAL